ncbi:GbsR/MarR family transcriptional regulator [Actinocatenispora rupis]|uniref:HTH-type transcriptional regulator MmpR5 n=1 Tax=Actinocatenispora rupis TaxID=519421 RepID=A0A8J3N999_9ACTN|nr:MarR family transcriptional regulator [Actinocatenispora rupis]GID10911.1 HTH-type transcriptional regulator MmpR5 [Actinocatenispora rupis]
MDELRRYAEEFALEFARNGTPPANGKLMGWLLVCDPPAQTSAQLGAALGLSKGSVSTGMRMLVRTGIARRVVLPGTRGHAYEITPDAMARATSDAIPQWRSMAELLDRGVDLLGPGTPRARRLTYARDFYQWIVARIPELVEEFKREHGL